MTDQHRVFVLHRRHLRESSLLLTLFSQSYGIVHAVARGALHARGKSRLCHDLFTELAVRWYGRYELKTLTMSEIITPAVWFGGDRCFCAQYVNELLYRLLVPGEAHPTLFTTYRRLLIALASYTGNLQILLRIFEHQLLTELGYALRWSERNTQAPLRADEDYIFIFEQGFERSLRNDAFCGAHLIAMRDQRWELCLPAARRLSRQLFDHLLGGRTLHAHSLYQHLKR